MTLRAYAGVMRGQKTEPIHGLSQTLKMSLTLTDTVQNIAQNRSQTASLASVHGVTSSSALVRQRLNISP